MERQLGTPDMAGEDELARQRRKHWDESLQRPVAWFPATTLAEVLAEVLAAEAQAEADAGETDLDFDVVQFLAAQGHCRETIDTLCSYFCLDQAAGAEGTAAVCEVIEWPQGRQRMIDRIRSMLLDD